MLKLAPLYAGLFYAEMTLFLPVFLAKIMVKHLGRMRLSGLPSTVLPVIASHDP